MNKVYDWLCDPMLC